MNPDFLDLLRALLAQEARFLVVGAHALAVHGVPRATGDLDVWIDSSPANAARVWRALEAFGAPMDAFAVTAADLDRPNMVVQLGLPPRRVDLLTSRTGLDFAAAWAGRIMQEVEGCVVPFLGRAALVTNKRATGRLKDRADLEALGEDPGSEQEPSA